MSFESPGGLWLLAAIPFILLLWMLRPRRPRMRIPSVMLWPASSAERRSARPWQRLRNHPLLWLQVLVALLLAIAAAQPFIPAEAADQRLIVLLDASGSMRAHDVAPSRWDAARAAVTDLTRTLGPDQTVSVIRADDAPRILVTDTRDAALVESILADETPAFGAIDTATTLSLAAGIARGVPSEWVLVGDGDFPEATPAAGTGVPPQTRFRFVRIGSSSAANLSLTGLTLRSDGSSYAAQLGIRNASDMRVNGAVQLLAEGGAVVANSEWSAEPHQDTYVAWSGVEVGPHWFEARLVNTSLNPPEANALDSDDSAWAAADPANSTQQRALLVTAGNTFLERALALQGSVRTFKVSPTDWPALVAQGDAAMYALLVVDRQSASTDAPPSNALYVGGATGATFQPRVIAPRSDHPLLRNVDFSDVRIGRAAQLPADEAEAWESVVDSDGGPLLVVRTVRDGERVRREALLTFALGDSDLPLRPAFPVLMANLLQWLAPRPDGMPQNVAPGVSLQLDASPLASSVHIESVSDASAPPEQLAPPWPPRSFRPPRPGVYRALEEDPDGSVTTYVVADGFSQTESDLSPREPTALVSRTTQSSDVGQVLRSVRSGVWPWLLAILLGLAAIEWVVDARGR